MCIRDSFFSCFLLCGDIMGSAASRSKKNKSKDAPKKEEVVVEDLAESSKAEATTFENQAGGHAGAFLKGGDGQIMKKVGKNEFTFYKDILHQHPKLVSFAPTFFGTEEKDGHNYIVIQDLTKGFSKPCILDIKIGTSSVGEDASPEKKAAMEKKDKGTTTVSLGMRITAMRVFDETTGEFKGYDKAWGKSVTDTTFLESLKVYFHNGNALRSELVPSFIELLKNIHAHVDEQRHLRIYSSSLLFIYDGVSDNSKVDLRMIDFAHVHPITDGGKDDGYIFGVSNLIEHLQKIEA
eukprot:TRINITY_DN14876_c0_g2_i1.p1 TRINITY_DN14876_c0_g2~~TRINITY_DN14876_c0_g2_i1.p1  ORF type:complete len:294 (+),score=78.41 TRINITY_DN14876_c0_g2_i1:52-933(+)